MRQLDPDIPNARAVVVDADPNSRSSLMSMLKSFGVGQIDQLARVGDARRVLPALQFDIIVCEYHFPGEAITGQELIDELRLGQKLPLSTVVILVTGDASYSHVAEAAESAVDAYLIKPHTREGLRHKLAEARARKRQLQPILEKVDAKAYAEAAELCNQLFEARGPGWVQAARIGAELMLKLGDAQGALRLQEAVLATKALPWARTGITQADAPPGSLNAPRRTLESLLAEQPGLSDAYDVMCRTMLEQGDAPGALAAMRRASALNPASVPRLQKYGVLAFYYGDAGEALQALQQATDIGLTAKAYDLQGLVLLATLQFDRRMARELAQSQSAMGRLLSLVPSSVRLNRFSLVIDTLRLVAMGRMTDAVDQVKHMLQSVREPQFDFEAACNALMLAARLEREDAAVDHIEVALVQLAQRFAVSKATCELLVSAARREEALTGTIRQGYAQIGAHAEAGVSLSVAGKPQAAVEELLLRAEETLNCRLLDLAEHTLQRHHSAIRDTQPLKQRIDALRQRYHSYGAQLRMVRAA
jgi:CheY-like chemotaxis protein